MGADASAYLYLGVKFESVYKKDKDVKEYDLHDPKTGLKTGKKGQDTTVYYENLHTKERFDDDRYDLPTEKYTHNLEQESEKYIIGVCVGSCSTYGEQVKSINKDVLDKAYAEFEKNVRPFVGDLQPELMLNLYWSY